MVTSPKYQSYLFYSGATSTNRLQLWNFYPLMYPFGYKRYRFQNQPQYNNQLLQMIMVREQNTTTLRGCPCVGGTYVNNFFFVIFSHVLATDTIEIMMISWDWGPLIVWQDFHFWGVVWCLENSVVITLTISVTQTISHFNKIRIQMILFVVQMKTKLKFLC